MDITCIGQSMIAPLISVLTTKIELEGIDKEERNEWNLLNSPEMTWRQGRQCNQPKDINPDSCEKKPLIYPPSPLVSVFNNPLFSAVSHCFPFNSLRLSRLTYRETYPIAAALWRNSPVTAVTVILLNWTFELDFWTGLLNWTFKLDF